MPVPVVCPGCQARLNAPDQAVGRSVKCPKCGTPVRIGQPGTKPSPKKVPALPEGVMRIDPARVYSEADLELLDAVSSEAELRRASRADNLRKPGHSLKEWAKDLNMPDVVVDEIEEELGQKETVVWVGRPAEELLAAERRQVKVIAPFVIAGGAIILVALPFLVPSEVPLIARLMMYAIGGLVGTAFAGIGAFLLFKDRLPGALDHAWYVLTTRRALIVEALRRRGKRLIRSYNAMKLEGMKRIPSSNHPGAGDLVFEQISGLQGEHGRRSGQLAGQVDELIGSSDRGPRLKVGFLMVDDLRAVEQLVRETLIDRPVDKMLAD